MAESIELWHAEHANYARLLDLLEQQVAAFRAGEDPNYGVMVDIIGYLGEYPDRLHHPHEDAMFERLVLRDPALRMPINRLTQEHRVIAVAGQELRARLNEIAAGALFTRSTLEAAAALYLAYYRHHLASQEREVLPRAARLLTQDDWNFIHGAVPVQPDPLFGDAPQEHFRELRGLLDATAPAP